MGIVIRWINVRRGFVWTIHAEPLSSFPEEVQHLEDFLFGGCLVDADVTNIAKEGVVKGEISTKVKENL